MTSPSSSPSNSAPDTPSQVPASPPHVNLRNPVPLSALQESQVQDIYHKRVRRHCASEIKAFAACAMNRTVSLMWRCRDERQTMNSCMVAHVSPEEEDKAREEWFAGKDERRRQRELEHWETETRRAEVINIMKENEKRKRRENSAE